MVLNQKTLTFAFKKSRVSPFNFTMFPTLEKDKLCCDLKVIHPSSGKKEVVLDIYGFRGECKRFNLSNLRITYNDFNSYIMGCFSPWFKLSFFMEPNYRKAHAYKEAIRQKLESTEFRLNIDTMKLNIRYKEFFKVPQLYLWSTDDS